VGTGWAGNTNALTYRAPCCSTNCTLRNVPSMKRLMDARYGFVDTPSTTHKKNMQRRLANVILLFSDVSLSTQDRKTRRLAKEEVTENKNNNDNNT
jgi:hypothetical protein